MKGRDENVSIFVCGFFLVFLNAYKTQLRHKHEYHQTNSNRHNNDDNKSSSQTFISKEVKQPFKKPIFKIILLATMVSSSTATIVTNAEAMHLIPF